MADHKGLPVAGYQEQTSDSVALVNENKVLEERVLRQLDAMVKLGTCDGRLLAIGRTQLQGAFMFINRAVFQPGRVALPEDADPNEPAAS